MSTFSTILLWVGDDERLKAVLLAIIDWCPVNLQTIGCETWGYNRFFLKNI
jgi:hypothetical protein